MTKAFCQMMKLLGSAALFIFGMLLTLPLVLAAIWLSGDPRFVIGWQAGVDRRLHRYKVEIDELDRILEGDDDDG